MNSIRAWLTLQAIKGLRPGTLSRLVLRFGSPEALQTASIHDLTSEGGVSLSVANAIVGKPDAERLTQIEQEMIAVEHGDFSILTILDPEYPPR